MKSCSPYTAGMLRYALWWMLKCENNWHGRVPCGSGLDHLVLMMSFLETHLSPHAMDLFLFDWLLLPLVVSGYLSFLHESWTYFFFYFCRICIFSPYLAWFKEQDSFKERWDSRAECLTGSGHLVTSAKYSPKPSFVWPKSTSPANSQGLEGLIT